MKIIYDDGIWRYEDHKDKDIWDRKIYRAFFLDKFSGYRWKRSKKEIKEVRKKLGNNVGVMTWFTVPEENIKH